jgi:uncharacterized protein YdaU (DUF1376 family)
MGLKYMPFFVGDYVADTGMLNTEEHGAYFLLLINMWTNGGRLPNVPRKLAAVAKLGPKKWAAIWPNLEHYFEVDGEWLVNRKLQRVMGKAEESSSQKSTAGRQGAAAKALKNQESAPNSAEASRAKAESKKESPTPKPKDSSSPPATARRRAPETPIPEGFPDDAARQAAQERIQAARVNVSVQREAMKFRDWCLSRDHRYRDWPAAFRNWIGKAIEFAGGDPAANVVTLPPNRDMELRMWRAWMQEFSRNRNCTWDRQRRGPRPDEPGCVIPADIMAEFGHQPALARAQ